MELVNPVTSIAEVKYLAILGGSQLTIDIPNIRAARQSSTHPSRRRILRNEIVRILDILFQVRNHRRKDAVELLLRDRTALLSLAHLLAVQKQTLHVSIPTTTTHIWYTQEGSRLRPNEATIALEFGLITKNRVGVDGRIIEPESFPGIY